MEDYINIPGSGTTEDGQIIARLLKKTCLGSFDIESVALHNDTWGIKLNFKEDEDYLYICLVVEENPSSTYCKNENINLFYTINNVEFNKPLTLFQVNNCF